MENNEILKKISREKGVEQFDIGGIILTRDMVNKCIKTNDEELDKLSGLVKNEIKELFKKYNIKFEIEIYGVCESCSGRAEIEESSSVNGHHFSLLDALESGGKNE